MIKSRKLNFNFLLLFCFVVVLTLENKLNRINITSIGKKPIIQNNLDPKCILKKCQAKCMNYALIRWVIVLLFMQSYKQVVLLAGCNTIGQWYSQHLETDAHKVTRTNCGKFHQLSFLIRLTTLLFQPTILAKYQPEIDLLLNTALWRYSVQKSGATFGQEMLFLKYNPQQLQSTKLVLHYVLTIVTKYCSDLGTHRFTDHELLQRVIQWTERTLNLLHFVNLFRFLKTGRMPTIVDFLLGLNYVAAVDNQKRNIGFYYMTRELFWEGLIELVGITVPLINYHSVKRRLNRLVSPTGPRRDYREDVEVVKVTTDTMCAFCDDRPRIPSHFGCGHVFCHYCLKVSLWYNCLYFIYWSYSNSRATY